MVTTDEEAPKGFEGYFADKQDPENREGLVMNCVTLSQMASSEIAELDELRRRALDNYEATTGKEAMRLPINEELGLAPEGSTSSDKLIFRAYKDGSLVAYAHVLCGWPCANEWTVEQLLLDPTHRLQGIGSKLIDAIEQLARTAEVRATSILSLPTRDGAESFWRHLGYQDRTAELASQLGGSVVTVMRKEL